MRRQRMAVSALRASVKLQSSTSGISAGDSSALGSLTGEASAPVTFAGDAFAIGASDGTTPSTTVFSVNVAFRVSVAAVASGDVPVAPLWWGREVMVAVCPARGPAIMRTRVPGRSVEGSTSIAPEAISGVS